MKTKKNSDLSGCPNLLLPYLKKEKIAASSVDDIDVSV